MSKASKIILWIFLVIILPIIIVLLTEAFTWDDISSLLVIVLVGIIEIFKWIRANIEIFAGIAFIGFCIYSIKGLYDNNKEMKERLERLEGKSKSNKK